MQIGSPKSCLRMAVFSTMVAVFANEAIADDAPVDLDILGKRLTQQAMPLQENQTVIQSDDLAPQSMQLVQNQAPARRGFSGPGADSDNEALPQDASELALFLELLRKGSDARERREIIRLRRAGQ